MEKIVSIPGGEADHPSIITISNTNFYGDTAWKMNINIEEIVKLAGKKEKDMYDKYFVVYPVPRAKRLLKFIKPYLTSEDRRTVTYHVCKNAKLFDYWNSLMEK